MRFMFNCQEFFPYFGYLYLISYINTLNCDFFYLSYIKIFEKFLTNNFIKKDEKLFSL